jgi:hypothetical protein
MEIIYPAPLKEYFWEITIDELPSIKKLLLGNYIGYLLLTLNVCGKIFMSENYCLCTIKEILMWIAKLLLDNYVSLKNYCWAITVGELLFCPKIYTEKLLNEIFPNNIVALSVHVVVQTTDHIISSNYCKKSFKNNGKILSSENCASSLKKYRWVRNYYKKSF